MIHKITLSDKPSMIYKRLDDILQPNDGYIRQLGRVKIPQYSTITALRNARNDRKFMYVATFDPNHVRIPIEDTVIWSAAIRLRTSEEKKYKKQGRLTLDGLWIFTMDSLESEAVPLMGYRDKREMRQQLGHHREKGYTLDNNDIVCAWSIVNVTG